MTPESKEKITQSMLAYLSTRGYPNLDINQILAELPNLWNKLSSEGLLDEHVKKGLTYQAFCDIARQKAVEALMMQDFQNFMRGQGR